jgi:signal transduction histidine kinase/DNA-binding NarL/FixJ family response regulator
MTTAKSQGESANRGRSLAAKISIFATVLVLWVSVTLLGVSVVRESRDSERAAQERAGDLARFVALLIRAPLENGEHDNLRRLIESANQSAEGLQVSVRGSSGARLYGADLPDGWRSVSVPAGAIGSMSRTTVVVGWGEANWLVSHATGLLPLLAAGLVVLGVAIAVARLTLRSLIRPLEVLENAMTSVRRGKLHPVPIVRSGDEIERLGTSFNEMLHELERFRQQAAENQELLEERIRQRTQALGDALLRAESANRARAEFLANASHELRTPLNGILGMLGLTLSSDLGAADRENLETARNCAESLLQLIVDILSLSRIEAGHLELSRKPFEIRKVLEKGLESLREQALRKQLQFDFSVGPSVPVLLKGDPERLCQVVFNVVANAVKFTPAGRVSVWVGADDLGTGQAKIWIEVSDTGPGITEQDIAQIFESFRQSDSSSRRRHGGLGLGLTVAQRLLHLQGGRIMVESEPGRGSTFRMWLVLDRVSGFSVVSQGSAGDLPAGGPGRILVADDSAVNQKIVVSLLARVGYQCESVENGSQALERLAGSHYDLLLLDVQMPVLDGYGVLRILRADPRLRRLPVVAMSAMDGEQERGRCLESGFDAFVPKPVRSEQLLKAVEGLARRTGASRESPEASLQATPPPLNESAALALLDHDPKLLTGVVQLFLQVAPDRLSRLSSALECGRLSDLLSEAEKLRVAAEAIAAEPLAHMARQLEERALKADLRDAPQLLFSLGEELERLHRHAQPARQGIRTVA